jgi:hypothetical protein
VLNFVLARSGHDGMCSRSQGLGLDHPLSLKPKALPKRPKPLLNLGNLGLDQCCLVIPFLDKTIDMNKKYFHF